MNWTQVSLRSKLVISAVTGVLLVMILATTITITTQISVQEELANQQSIEITKGYANKFDGDMRSNMAIARAISSSMSEYNSSDRDEVNRMLHRILEDNPHLLGTYVAYEPNAFDGRDSEFINTEGHDASGRFIPFWNKIEGEIVLEPLQDYETLEYYVYPKVFNKNFITDPYYYEDVFMVSYVAPIIKDDEFLGVAGVDVSLKYVDDIVSQIKAFDTGYAIMTGSTGTILSQPYNKDWIGHKTIYDYDNKELAKAADDIQHEKSGHVNTVDPVTGKEVVVFYEPVKSKNYGLFLVVPRNEMLAGTFALRDKLIGIGILSVFFMGLAAYVASRSVTASIDDIVNDFKDMADAAAEGKLNIRANTDIDEDFRKIPEGLNHILDGVMVPVEETIRVAEQLSKGDLKTRFEGEYAGEFRKLADSMNVFAKVLDLIINDSNQVLSAMKEKDFTRDLRVHGHGDLKLLTDGIEQTRHSLQQASVDQQITEQELKEYAKKLEHSNELKDMFTDILRHDLLNPAGVVKGYTELLLMIENDEKTERYLNKIWKSNYQLIEMIQSASQFAKLESSENLELESLEIVEVINNSIEILANQAADKEIEIEFIEDREYFVLANNIIETVFTNIISNAIKYSPERTKVIIKIKENSEHTEITITDFGEGIDNAYKKTIFDRFERVNKSGVKGSGLGLAIVKRTIELHKGEVGARDNPEGQGTVFWIRLNKLSEGSSE
ncbi:HAMP domain-containing protein [Methanococcoides sp. SA1]|nr:HAMP domain-containing protein [Methanococcoides sp. SA1]